MNTRNLLINHQAGRQFIAMFQILYLIIFAILTVLAITNLVRNIIMVYSERDRTPVRRVPVSHPELLDSSGNVVNEPLMVMRAASVDDIRDRLDALYNASPGEDTDEDK